MFCSKCGLENVTEARFCKGCGNSLKNTNASENEDPNKNVEKQKSLLEMIKLLPKRAWIMCIGIVILAIILLVIINIKTRVNLNDYVIVETSGYDGYGTARVSVDWKAIENKYGDSIKLRSAAEKEYGELFGFLSPVEMMSMYIEIEVNQNSNLSNGDKLEYTWSISERLTDYLKCKITATNNTYKVTNLQEVETIDVFSELEVSFNGMEPDGSIILDYDGEVLNTNQFVCNRWTGLSNGESVIVSINVTDIDSFVQRYGVLPSILEKEYIVGGLDEYVASFSNLSDNDISVLMQEADNVILAYAANEFSSTTSLSDLEYVGYIFCNMKENGRGLFSNDANKAYVIFRGTISSSTGKFNTKKVYFPVRFTGLVNDDGMRFDSDYRIVGSSWLEGYLVSGYVNPYECYSEIISSNSDRYDIEVAGLVEEYAVHRDISNISDISTEYINILYNDAVKKVQVYIEERYDSSMVVNGLASIGHYLLVAKANESSDENKNRFIVVCSAEVSHSDGKFDTTTVYFPVEYDGLISLPKNEYMFTDSKGILGDSAFSNRIMSTKGYINGTEMFSKVVVANKVKYTYEVSESIKYFGE